MSDLQQQMALRSTDELLRMCRHEADQYTHDALEAARLELTKRDVSPELEHKASMDTMATSAVKAAAADEPLGLAAIVGLALFPISILFYLVIVEGFRQRGQFRKARHATMVMLLWPALGGLAVVVTLVRMMLVAP